MTLSTKQETPDGSVYALEFKLQAQDEWRKLSSTIQVQLAKKLEQRLVNPRVEADKLRNMAGCYKIKLQAAGVRLVYQVVDSRLVVIVVAVGKRERGQVYRDAARRF
jgi:mRNA interferase RelE/StbE